MGSSDVRGKVAVFSASGRPGLAQVRQLKAAGYAVRAVTRQTLSNPVLDGVEVVAADLNDPASLERACSGVDAVFFTSPTFAEGPKTVQHSGALGAAALRAGVARVVYNTTSWYPDEPIGVPTMDKGYEKTRALRESGVPLTVIRPSLFMDNLLTKWLKPFVVEHHEFSYPHAPDLEVSWICLDDVAKFMIAGLQRDDMAGQTVDVGGPEALRPGEVAVLLSEVLGRPIAYREITGREFGERMYDVFKDVTGLDRETYVTNLEKHYQFKNTTNPFKVDIEAALRRLPVQLTPMREWLARQDWSSAEEVPVGSVSG